MRVRSAVGRRFVRLQADTTNSEGLGQVMLEAMLGRHIFGYRVQLRGLAKSRRHSTC